MKHENLYRWLALSLIVVMVLELCFIIPTSANEETTVSISPQDQQVMQNEEFTVEIVVDPKVAIAGMQFDLSFDASLVIANSVQEGDLLNQNAASTYFASGTIDNEAGTITGVAGAITTPGETVSSPGTFATITFTAGITGGTSPLDLSNVIVGDINGDPVPITVSGGSVNVGLNKPPNTPSNPSPTNHATNVSINADLSWSGGDPDAGDAVTYDVYFGNNSTPPFSETIGPYPATQSFITHDLGTLVPGATYYWQIVARDNHGITEEGPAWEFTVKREEIELSLQAGWNMISLPVEPETTDPDVILPDVEVIYTWNCETTSYDSPSEIVPGKGYWALVFENVTETIDGTPVEEYQLSSDCEGWHMIGSLSVEAELIVDSGDVYDTLYHWDPETLSYTARSLDDVRPGEGYWLLAFTDFSISVVPKSPV